MRLPVDFLNSLLRHTRAKSKESCYRLSSPSCARGRLGIGPNWSGFDFRVWQSPGMTVGLSFFGSPHRQLICLLQHIKWHTVSLQPTYLPGTKCAAKSSARACLGCPHGQALARYDAGDAREAQRHRVERSVELLHGMVELLAGRRHASGRSSPRRLAARVSLVEPR